MLKYSVCLWLINHINHVIWTNQTVQDDFFFFYIYSGFLATVCFTDLHYGLQMWACCSQMDDDDHRCQPVTSVSFPHAHRKSSPSLQVICISYISHSMRILHSYVLFTYVVPMYIKIKNKKNQVAKVCNLLPLGAQFRICRYCINIYVSVPNFTHRCVMCDEYI